MSVEALEGKSLPFWEEGFLVDCGERVVQRHQVLAKDEPGDQEASWEMQRGEGGVA
jgi:hypothetical protein